MNRDELKENWDKLHDQGLSGHAEKDISEIVQQGTSKLVGEINRRLFRDMVITAFAATISAFAMIAFYFAYDPVQHIWIDAAKITRIQLGAFSLFFMLFLFGWMEYQLVNQRFTAESVHTYLSSLLHKLTKYSRLFLLVTLPLLLVTYYLELDYFFPDEGSLDWVVKMGGALVLLSLSYVVIRWYARKTFGRYLADLASFQKELDA